MDFAYFVQIVLDLVQDKVLVVEVLKTYSATTYSLGSFYQDYMTILLTSKNKTQFWLVVLAKHIKYNNTVSIL